VEPSFAVVGLWLVQLVEPSFAVVGLWLLEELLVGVWKFGYLPVK
jgi:hypothetical protein